MKRHPLLVPLSREHHHLLVLTQVLRSDVPTYHGMPATAPEKLTYAIEQYRERLAPHMKQEEKWLLPLARSNSQRLQAMADRILQEHQQIRSHFELLPHFPEQRLAEQLHALALLLAHHIRYEERVFFQAVQEANLLSKEE